MRRAVEVIRDEGFIEFYKKIHNRISPQSRASSKIFEAPQEDYETWIQMYATLRAEDREVIQNRIALLKARPVISIVMPTFNPPLHYLREAIDSIIQQLYPYWELCIADDASTDSRVKEVLNQYASQDSRIKVCFREKNGHISAASNTALQMASGQWVALIDQDDLISEDALYRVAELINQDSDLKLIYSDEDKIDINGKRIRPYFKPDWNLDLFYSHNLVSHLGVFHKDTLVAIGGFQEGLDGSQDYDLALRFIEVISASAIGHIPRVLYHWRIHEQSTAQNPDAKPYAMLAGERAINEHLARKGIKGQVSLMKYGYRPKYELPESAPQVSLIIPTKDNLKLIKSCINSILEKTTYKNYEIILVDNGSTDTNVLHYYQTIADQRNIRLIEFPGKFNYSAMNNYAVQFATGKILGLLNNDIEVISPDWIEELVSHALRDEIGAVGAKLLYPNDTIQHSGVLIGVAGLANHAHRHFDSLAYGYYGRGALVNNYSAVTGACLFIRKSLYLQAGGLDENNLKISYNDVDFCLKLVKLGYRNLYNPWAILYHHESASRGYDRDPEAAKQFLEESTYFEKKWADFISCDPMYNVNLSNTKEDFSLSWPPRIELV
jgi:glycosyltransferase involved in cell wall biosynthesis